MQVDKEALATHLGDEPPSLAKQITSKLQGREGESGLGEGILHPRCTDVRSTIVQDAVGLP